MNYNITREGRFFGTVEALEQDMRSFIDTQIFELGLGTYSDVTKVYVCKEGEIDRRVYWRLLTADADRRNQVAGMEFSHVTFHHTCQCVAEVHWVLTRLRFPQAYRSS